MPTPALIRAVFCCVTILCGLSVVVIAFRNRDEAGKLAGVGAALAVMGGVQLSGTRSMLITLLVFVPATAVCLLSYYAFVKERRTKAKR